MTQKYTKFFSKILSNFNDSDKKHDIQNLHSSNFTSDLIKTYSFKRGNQLHFLLDMSLNIELDPLTNITSGDGYIAWTNNLAHRLLEHVNIKIGSGNSIVSSSVDMGRYLDFQNELLDEETRNLNKYDSNNGIHCYNHNKVKLNIPLKLWFSNNDLSNAFPLHLVKEDLNIDIKIKNMYRVIHVSSEHFDDVLTPNININLVTTYYNIENEALLNKMKQIDTRVISYDKVEYTEINSESVKSSNKISIGYNLIKEVNFALVHKDRDIETTSANDMYDEYTGSAATGSVSTITLATHADANGDDTYFAESYITLTGNTGNGQSKKIIHYNSTTKIATISGYWTTTPDNTTTYSLKRSKIQINSDKSTNGANDNYNYEPVNLHIGGSWTFDETGGASDHLWTTATAHGLSIKDSIIFTHSGAGASGHEIDKRYYVTSTGFSTTTVTLSETSGGSVLAGTGNSTNNWRAKKYLEDNTIFSTLNVKFDSEDDYFTNDKNESFARTILAYKAYENQPKKQIYVINFTNNSFNSGDAYSAYDTYRRQNMTLTLNNVQIDYNLHIYFKTLNSMTIYGGKIQYDNTSLNINSQSLLNVLTVNDIDAEIETIRQIETRKNPNKFCEEPFETQELPIKDIDLKFLLYESKCIHKNSKIQLKFIIGNSDFLYLKYLKDNLDKVHLKLNNNARYVYNMEIIDEDIDASFPSYIHKELLILTKNILESDKKIITYRDVFVNHLDHVKNFWICDKLKSVSELLDTQIEITKIPAMLRNLKIKDSKIVVTLNSVFDNKTFLKLNINDETHDHYNFLRCDNLNLKVFNIIERPHKILMPAGVLSSDDNIPKEIYDLLGIKIPNEFIPLTETISLQDIIYYTKKLYNTNLTKLLNITKTMWYEKNNLPLDNPIHKKYTNYEYYLKQLVDIVDALNKNTHEQIFGRNFLRIKAVLAITHTNNETIKHLNNILDQYQAISIKYIYREDGGLTYDFVTPDRFVQNMPPSLLPVDPYNIP